MPGSSGYANRYGLTTTYSNAYSRHSSSGRSPSSTRKYSPAPAYTPSRTSSTSRPLPTGPGPLDTSGRRLSNYSASDFKRTTYSPTTRTPLKADHSFGSSYTSNRSSAIDYSPSVGTLTRKYSSSDTTKTDTLNRSRRAQSIAVDRVDRDLSHITLNGQDSIKASPRVVDSDDSIFNRTSRKDRYNTEQKLHDDNVRMGSRGSRLSVTSDNKQDDDLFSPRSEHQSRASSISRDTVKKKDSWTDTQNTQNKSLSRQSSSSSLSNVSETYRNDPKFSDT